MQNRLGNQLPDHKRPLNKRGLFDAEFMSSLDVVNHFSPMLFFVVRQNAPVKPVIFLKNAVFQKPSALFRSLYDFSGAGLEAFIHTMIPHLSNVFIFGHNHALTAIVNAKAINI